uniref:Uncharacterized protein n=1 Tax=Trichuris muris TaxID=70415 RepID=A0A5S6R460_TRIMR
MSRQKNNRRHPLLDGPVGRPNLSPAASKAACLTSRREAKRIAAHPAPRVHQRRIAKSGGQHGHGGRLARHFSLKLGITNWGGESDFALARGNAASSRSFSEAKKSNTPLLPSAHPADLRDAEKARESIRLLKMAALAGCAPPSYRRRWAQAKAYALANCACKGWPAQKWQPIWPRLLCWMTPRKKR